MSINILKKVTCFTNDFKGATAIEYALIAAFIALAIIAGLATSAPAVAPAKPPLPKTIDTTETEVPSTVIPESGTYATTIPTQVIDQPNDTETPTTPAGPTGAMDAPATPVAEAQAKTLIQLNLMTPTELSSHLQECYGQKLSRTVGKQKLIKVITAHQQARNRK